MRGASLRQDPWPLDPARDDKQCASDKRREQQARSAFATARHSGAYLPDEFQLVAQSRIELLRRQYADEPDLLDPQARDDVEADPVYLAMTARMRAAQEFMEELEARGRPDNQLLQSLNERAFELADPLRVAEDAQRWALERSREDLVAASATLPTAFRTAGDHARHLRSSLAARMSLPPGGKLSILLLCQVAARCEARGIRTVRQLEAALGRGERYPRPGRRDIVAAAEAARSRGSSADWLRAERAAGTSLRTVERHPVYCALTLRETLRQALCQGMAGQSEPSTEAEIEAVARKCEAGPDDEPPGLGIRSGAELRGLLARAVRRHAAATVGNAMLESVVDVIGPALLLNLLVETIAPADEVPSLERGTSLRQLGAAVLAIALTYGYVGVRAAGGGALRGEVPAMKQPGFGAEFLAGQAEAGLVQAGHTLVDFTVAPRGRLWMPAHLLVDLGEAVLGTLARLALQQRIGAGGSGSVGGPLPAWLNDGPTTAQEQQAVDSLRGSAWQATLAWPRTIRWSAAARAPFQTTATLVHRVCKPLGRIGFSLAYALNWTFEAALHLSSHLRHGVAGHEQERLLAVLRQATPARDRAAHWERAPEPAQDRKGQRRGTTAPEHDGGGHGAPGRDSKEGKASGPADPHDD